MWDLEAGGGLWEDTLSLRVSRSGTKLPNLIYFSISFPLLILRLSNKFAHKLLISDLCYIRSLKISLYRTAFYSLISETA